LDDNNKEGNKVAKNMDFSSDVYLLPERTGSSLEEEP
jgi:hypothetical protein